MYKKRAGANTGPKEATVLKSLIEFLVFVLPQPLHLLIHLRTE